MINIAAAQIREEVEIKAFKINGEEHDFRFEVGHITADQYLDLIEPKNFSSDIRELITFEEIAELVHEWDSPTGLLNDAKTDVKVTCTKAHVLGFLRGVPEGLPLVTAALVRAYAQRLAKNSDASSRSRGTAGQTTAKAAKRRKKQRRK